MSRSGTISVDSFRLKTNDGAFVGVPRVSINDVSVNEGTGTGATATADADALVRACHRDDASPGRRSRDGVGAAATSPAAVRHRHVRGRCHDGDRSRSRSWATRSSEANEVFYVVLSRAVRPHHRRRRGPGHDPQRRRRNDAVGDRQRDRCVRRRDGSQPDRVHASRGRAPRPRRSRSNIAWSGSREHVRLHHLGRRRARCRAPSLTFAAGSATVTVTVTPIDDSGVEGTETVTLGLVAGSGYTLGSPVERERLDRRQRHGRAADASRSPRPTRPARRPAPNPITFNVTRTGSTARALAVNIGVERYRFRRPTTRSR